MENLAAVESNEPTTTVETPAPRKRGRPPKVRTPEELAKLNAPKRPRGRPRKNPLPAPEV